MLFSNLNCYSLINIQNKYIPTLIPNLNNIIAISAGFDHSLILDNNGNVYSFGYGNAGQLGIKSHEELGNDQTMNIPIKWSKVKDSLSEIFGRKRII